MARHIFLQLLFCVLIISCNNKQETESIATLPDSILNNLHICTEFPLINTDSSQNGVKEAGALKYLLWPVNKKVLNISFLDGDSTLKEKVKNKARQWENYCGIKLNFDDSIINPDITISFRQNGSWSAIGKSSVGKKPSMNFGWLRKNSDDIEFNRVVLHEFGHALGLIHEHQNPNNNPVKWDTALVYKYYMLPPNHLSKNDVDANMFKKYNDEQINGTSFDSLSIMLYAIPKELTTDSFSTGWNTQLSELDKKLIGQLYPKKQE